MFENKKILITGGTGSLGTALAARLLTTDIDTVRIFSRDELKQSQMESHFNDKRLRFLIGDVRDKERLEKAVEGVNIVIHTAALKQVPVIEYNPFEAIKTNVQGAQNLVEACLAKDVEFALAVEPNNDTLCSYAKWVEEKRAQNQPTLPSTLKEQKNINPFLRAHELSVKTAAEAYCENNLADDVAVFAAVRRWKDEF